MTSKNLGVLFTFLLISTSIFYVQSSESDKTEYKGGPGSHTLTIDTEFPGTGYHPTGFSEPTGMGHPTGFNGTGYHPTGFSEPTGMGHPTGFNHPTGMGHPSGSGY